MPSRLLRTLQSTSNTCVFEKEQIVWSTECVWSSLQYILSLIFTVKRCNSNVQSNYLHFLYYVCALFWFRKYVASIKLLKNHRTRNPKTGIKVVRECCRRPCPMLDPLPPHWNVQISSLDQDQVQHSLKHQELQAHQCRDQCQLETFQKFSEKHQIWWGWHRAQEACGVWRDVQKNIIKASRILKIESTFGPFGQVAAGMR